MSPSIPAKVFAGYVALLLTFGAVSGFTVWQIHELGQRANHLYETLVPLPSVVADIRSELRSLEMVVDQTEPAALRRGVHIARRVHPTLALLEEALDRAEEHLADPRAPVTEQLSARMATLRRDARALAGATTTFFDAVEAGEAPRRRDLRRKMTTLGRGLVRFDAALQEALDRAVVTFGEEERSATWAVIVLATVAMFIGGLITFTAARLLRPLRSLRAAVERIAEGDYGETAVPVGGSGELRALAIEFNRMAGAIARRDAQLSAQQRELLDRERLATVGRMSAQITHELRNPLSSIGLNSELLLEELEPGTPVDQESARALLASIIREVDRLREITEEYLRFARLPRPECIPVDLNQAAEELLEFLRGEMSQAGVRTRLDPDPVAHPALVDPNQLRAAMLNLLRNAREATGQGGHVVVRIRSLGGAATLEVVDDGPGLSPEAAERLFEPFFSTKPQGTGLGLSIVRRIVRAQEGEVSVHSRGGRGTVARLTLPLARPDDGDLL